MQLMSDLSFRLNQQKTKHSEEMHQSTRTIKTLEEEVMTTRSSWSSDIHALQQQVVQLVCGALPYEHSD